MIAEHARRISPHFTWLEMLTTQVRGIANTPGPRECENLRRLCLTIMEPLRREFGPWHVSSGYRSPAINRVIGGSPNSRHMDGLAADGAPLNPAIRWADVISFALWHLPVDQVIFEAPSGHAWLHIGAALDGAEPRKQALMYFGRKYELWNPADPRVTR